MRLQTFSPAPFVSLFLALIPIALFCMESSQGLLLWTVTRDPRCIDDGPRTVVVDVLGRDVLKLNFASVKRRALGGRLEDRFKNLAERVLYVQAQGSVDFSDVAAVIDIASRHVDHVALLTRPLTNDPGFRCATASY